MTFFLHQGGVVMSSQIKHTHSHQDKKKIKIYYYYVKILLMIFLRSLSFLLIFNKGSYRVRTNWQTAYFHQSSLLGKA